MLNIKQIILIHKTLGEKMIKEITKFKLIYGKFNSKADTNKKNLQNNFKRLSAIKFNIITLKS